MNLRTEKKIIINKINKAWKRLPYSYDVANELVEYTDWDDKYIDRNTENAIRQLFVGKCWWELSDDFFDKNDYYMSSIIAFIGNFSLQYFFGAFLIYGLKCGEAMESIVNYLRLPKKTKPFIDFEKRMSFYTDKEKHVFLLFLRYAKKNYAHNLTELNIRAVKRIDYAIESYWIQYDSIQSLSTDSPPKGSDSKSEEN
jgi:hypothetical protein